MLWINTTVGEFCPLVYGKAIKKQDQLRDGYPVYGSNGMYTHSAKKLAGPHAVIIGRKGSVGKIHLSLSPCWVSDTAFYVQYDSLEEAYFTYYLISTLSLESMNTDAAVPGLNRNNAQRLSIRIPEKSEDRKKLVAPLIDLDKKIHLNHQINQTLEQMAEAIFKSCFVDFEPVKAKIAAREADGSAEDILIAAMSSVSGKDADQLAKMKSDQPEQYAELRATAELFPSAMQDSELGDIPAGWEATTFDAVSICLDKHRIPLSKAQRENRKGQVPYYGATSIMDYVDEPIFDGIYLLIGEDGSVLREDGTPFTQYIWGKSWVNNHAHVIQGTKHISTEQLLLFIKNQNITPYVTGAVQLKLNQKNMNSIPFVKAEHKVCEAFDQLISPMFAEIRGRHDESTTLTEVRNALLPRLLTGSINLKDTE